MNKNPTQREIARLAGVAQATVSFVLAGHGAKMKITPQVIENIQRIAADLGYVPNYNARSLVTGRSHTLGAMMYSSQGNPFWAMVAAGMHARALERGYDITLIPAQLTAEAVVKRYLRNRRIDAVVILNTDAPQGSWDAAALPPVSVSFKAVPGAPHVHLDLETGVTEAVDHLVAQGHRSALFIEEESHDSFGRGLIWQRIAATRGLSVRIARVANHHPRHLQIHLYIGAMRDRIVPLLRERGDATAVMGFNDLTAIGAMMAAEQLQLRIPQDLSVIGFDDREAAVANPPLTTVSHEFGPLGMAAAQVAVDLVEGTLSVEAARNLEVAVPSRLVVRATTGPARLR